MLHDNNIQAEVLDCKVSLIEENSSEIFTVEIRGTICAPAGFLNASANITISDITVGPDWVKPVHVKNQSGSIPFCTKTDLGRLPAEITTLSNWMPIAKIPVENLIFPRKGIRTLEFNISILDDKNRKEFTSARSDFIYENISIGYVELEQDIQNAKDIGTSLAFTVAASGKKISRPEIEIIYNWTKENISRKEILSKNRVAMIIDFLPFVSEIYCSKLCRKVPDSVPMKIRCQVMELCLRIAGTGNSITDTQLYLLKKIAYQLGINCETFRSMTEGVLPIRMHEIDDLEISLGITKSMNNDQLCRQLSKEYRKWNARVTNRNPEIEFQAEQMLKLIANLRNQYSI